MKDNFVIFRLLINKYRLFFYIAISFLIIAWIYLEMQEEVFGIKLIAENTTQLSILMLVVAFVCLLLNALFLKVSLPNNPNPDGIEEDNKKSDFAGALTRLLIGSFGASTIPTGISLTLCAFKGKNYIQYLSGAEIYIAFAGITLMSIAVLSIYEEKARMETEIKNINKVGDSTTVLKPPN